MLYKLLYTREDKTLLNIKAGISSINYKASLNNLLPAALEKCKNMPKQGGAVGFFQELNDASVNDISHILKCLPDSFYSRLLCITSRLYGCEITKSINSAIKNQGFGNSIKINEVLLNQENNGRLILYLNHVEADYNNLIKLSGEKLPEGFIYFILKKIIPVLSGIPSHKYEDKILSILQNSFVKKGLEGMAGKSLLNNGIVLDIDEIIFSKADDNIVEAIELEKLEYAEEDFLNILASILNPPR